MVAQKNRFHGHNSLRFLLGKGQTEQTPYFRLKHIANRRRQTWRLAIIVSKKVHKSAVVRNKIRRRLYELMRTHMPTMSTSPDMAIIVRDSQPAELDWQELMDSCRPLLAKLEKTYNQ